MSFALRREKKLPDIPVDIDASGAVVGDEGLYSIPSSEIATSTNTDKALPSINVEKTLSKDEISRLHELWNEAGLSARAHRRRRRGQNTTPRRIPAPISIPEPENVLPTFSPADPSITSTTPPTTGTRTRWGWGFRSARHFSETQEAAKKAPNALEILRTIAQDRLKKKVRYTKSAPNLGDQAVPLGRGFTFQPASLPVEAVLKDRGGGTPRHPTSPGELATPETGLQPEHMDANAICFTIDPGWRASQGSVQFQFITPIPDSPTSLGRPDSPLLHRHHSLDQLSFAAQQCRAMNAMGVPEVNLSDEVLHPIDELHAYLGL